MDERDDGPADVSALLAGDRWDVTSRELMELVRLARLGAEVERQAERHDAMADMEAELSAGDCAELDVQYLQVLAAIDAA